MNAKMSFGPIPGVDTVLMSAERVFKDLPRSALTKFTCGCILTDERDETQCITGGAIARLCQRHNGELIRILTAPAPSPAVRG
jgi:hypothetical protein